MKFFHLQLSPEKFLTKIFENFYGDRWKSRFRSANERATHGFFSGGITKLFSLGGRNQSKRIDIFPQRNYESFQKTESVFIPIVPWATFKKHSVLQRFSHILGNKADSTLNSFQHMNRLVLTTGRRKRFRWFLSWSPSCNGAENENHVFHCISWGENFFT